MLDGQDKIVLHRLQNLALICLSIIFLPLDTIILFASYQTSKWYRSKVEANRKAVRSRPSFRPRNVLITGVGMTKGLALARLFYEAGHDVIGADFEPNYSLVCGRTSRSLKRFHRLSKPTAHGGSTPYIQSLLEIIRSEDVTLWVSCSGVASAVEDGEAKEAIETQTSCKAIQFDVRRTKILHEKDSFIARTEEIGLVTPETKTVRSRADVEEIFRSAPAGRRYIMKTIGVDDSVRADMTLLPRPTQEETSRHIARLKISKQTPWIVQQFIQGQEFCTHSLVVEGKVKAFVACPSSELLMHYVALDPSSRLSRAMLKFTTHYANAEGAGFTGHLSFDFLVEDVTINDPSKELVLYPIECNPRAHTAVALFNRTTNMVDAYLSNFDQNASDQSVVIPVQKEKYYWIGHDFVTLLLIPLYNLLTLNMSFADFWKSSRTFLDHVVHWKDGTYESWDPLPWWWLYHVYWPMRFILCFMEGKKWSRINVSTTKMFEC